MHKKFLWEASQNPTKCSVVDMELEVIHARNDELKLQVQLRTRNFVHSLFNSGFLKPCVDKAAQNLESLTVRFTKQKTYSKYF